MTMNFSAVMERHAERFPDGEVIAFEERHITRAQLSRRGNALASAFSQLGVGWGDRVAILLYNCPEYIEVILATNKLGAIFLPLNFRLAAEEFAYILNNSGTKLLVTESDFFTAIDSIKHQVPSLKALLARGGGPTGWLDYESLIAKNDGAKVPDAEVGLDDLQRLMYTSGTTAHPKGVMIGNGNFYWKNIAHVIEFGLTAADKTLVVGPLYHVGGLDLPALVVLYIGGSLVILRRFDPVITLETIQQEKVTNVWLAPTMLNLLLHEPSLPKYDLSSLRLIIDGGEKMPLPLIQRLLSLVPHVWFADAYGLTETVSGDSALEEDKMIEKIGSVGKPVLHLQVRIVDDQGRKLPPGQPGEILLKGPKVFQGYWQNPQATADAIRDGWFHTGDIGMVDEEGYIYIIDRKKDMIISGGENIASLEVERVLYENPQVLEAAVVGQPHPRWGEVPVAFVVPKKGQVLDPQELIDACAGKLAKFKVPKQIYMLDALPRNPSGKVLKRELREKAKAAVGWV